MRVLFAVLWIQMALAGVGIWAAFGYAHWAAMGSEWWGDFEREFRQIQKSADYREPPVIQGLDYAHVIDAHRSSTRICLEMAGYGLAFCALLMVITAALLWRVHRLRSPPGNERTLAEPAAAQNSR